MKTKLPTVARLLLGLIYVVFSVSGLLNLLPQPSMSDKAMGFIGGLASSGYFLPVLAATEIIGGLLLLTGVAAPLALLILAPVTLHIFLFHAFLTPGWHNLVLPLCMGVLHLTAASVYWRMYRPLFSRGR
jgi:putative oxidoreductase